MSDKNQTFLEALEAEIRKQDQELAALRKQLEELPPDMEFAVPEDAMTTEAPVAIAAPLTTAFIRA